MCCVQSVTLLCACASAEPMGDCPRIDYPVLYVFAMGRSDLVEVKG